MVRLTDRPDMTFTVDVKQQHTTKYSKKAFDNLITYDDTWAYFFEPKWKYSNQIWAAKSVIISSYCQTNRKGKEGFVGNFLR